ncbi:MAG: zinc-ribbon domain-containing protein, partial [Proteobacteria bacterium]|nr:zinc-ribbon domain-containing protein [Pseudomonadota bacterium]
MPELQRQPIPLLKHCPFAMLCRKQGNALTDETKSGATGMIISCPSCKTQFRVDEARLTPDGKKVRCSKCGHVWQAMPDGQSAPSVEQPAPVMPTADRPV